MIKTSYEESFLLSQSLDPFSSTLSKQDRNIQATVREALEKLRDQNIKEVFFKIFSYLDYVSLTRLSRVSQLFHQRFQELPLEVSNAALNLYLEEAQAAFIKCITDIQQTDIHSPEVLINCLKRLDHSNLTVKNAQDPRAAFILVRHYLIGIFLKEKLQQKITLNLAEIECPALQFGQVAHHVGMFIRIYSLRICSSIIIDDLQQPVEPYHLISFCYELFLLSQKEQERTCLEPLMVHPLSQNILAELNRCLSHPTLIDCWQTLFKQDCISILISLQGLVAARSQALKTICERLSQHNIQLARHLADTIPEVFTKGEAQSVVAKVYLNNNQFKTVKEIFGSIHHALVRYVFLKNILKDCSTEQQLEQFHDIVEDSCESQFLRDEFLIELAWHALERKDYAKVEKAIFQVPFSLSKYGMESYQLFCCLFDYYRQDKKWRKVLHLLSHFFVPQERIIFWARLFQDNLHQNPPIEFIEAVKVCAKEDELCEACEIYLDCQSQSNPFQRMLNVLLERPLWRDPIKRQQVIMWAFFLCYSLKESCLELDAIKKLAQQENIVFKLDLLGCVVDFEQFSIETVFQMISELSSNSSRDWDEDLGILFRFFTLNKDWSEAIEIAQQFSQDHRRIFALSHISAQALKEARLTCFKQGKVDLSLQHAINSAIQIAPSFPRTFVCLNIIDRCIKTYKIAPDPLAKKSMLKTFFLLLNYCHFNTQAGPLQMALSHWSQVEFEESEEVVNHISDLLQKELQELQNMQRGFEYKMFWVNQRITFFLKYPLMRLFERLTLQLRAKNSAACMKQGIDCTYPWKLLKKRFYRVLSLEMKKSFLSIKDTFNQIESVYDSLFNEEKQLLCQSIREVNERMATYFNEQMDVQAYENKMISSLKQFPAYLNEQEPNKPRGGYNDLSAQLATLLTTVKQDEQEVLIQGICAGACLDYASRRFKCVRPAEEITMRPNSRMRYIQAHSILLINGLYQSCNHELYEAKKQLFTTIDQIECMEDQINKEINSPFLDHEFRQERRLKKFIALKDKELQLITKINQAYLQFFPFSSFHVSPDLLKRLKVSLHPVIDAMQGNLLKTSISMKTFLQTTIHHILDKKYEQEGDFIIVVGNHLANLERIEVPSSQSIQQIQSFIERVTAGNAPEKVKIHLLKKTLDKQVISKSTHAIHLSLKKPYELHDVNLPDFEGFTSPRLDVFKLLCLNWLSVMPYQTVYGLYQVKPD